MKKNILLFTLMLGFFVSNAQSIEFRIDSLGASVNGDTIIKTGTVNDADLEQHMWVTQTSGATMDIQAKVYVQSMTSGKYTVCWYVCYAQQSPSVTFFNPSHTVTVPDDSIVSNFSAHFYRTLGAPATVSQLRYVLYDTNNPSDSAYIDVKFDNNPTSVGDVSSQEVKLSAYPNPTSDFLTVDYDAKGVENSILSVYNVLGEEVLSRTLGASKGKERIDVSLMNSGVYFYAIKSQGKAIRTERFIVK